MNPTDLFFALSDSQYKWGEEGLPSRRILVELHRTAYALAIAATQPCNNPVKESAWLQKLNPIWYILAVLERPYCVQAFCGVWTVFQATCLCVRAFCVLKNTLASILKCASMFQSCQQDYYYDCYCPQDDGKLHSRSFFYCWSNFIRRIFKSSRSYSLDGCCLRGRIPGIMAVQEEDIGLIDWLIKP